MENIKNNLLNYYRKNEGLDKLRTVENIIRKNCKIMKEKPVIFHSHTIVLYNIRTYLQDKFNINNAVYLEIGSMLGASAGLMLRHPFNTEVICIDPCFTHRHKKKYDLLQLNLKDNNINNYNFKVYKNFSQDKDVLNKFKKNQLDILFIDGDHKYNAVINDFNNYKDFVKSGGFIVFDDYLDYKYSPDVKKAVDDITESLKKTKEYEIIGNIENEFILFKI